MIRWGIVLLLLCAAAVGGYYIPLRTETIRVGFVDVQALFNKERYIRSGQEFSQVQEETKKKIKERFGASGDVFSIFKVEGDAALHGFVRRNNVLTSALEGEAEDVLRLEAESNASALRDNFSADYNRTLQFAESLYREIETLSAKTQPSEIGNRLFNLKLKLEVLTRDPLGLTEPEVAALKEKIEKLQKLVEEQRDIEQRNLMETYESRTRAAREEVEREYEKKKTAMQKALDDRLAELRGELNERIKAVRRETERLAAEKRDFGNRVKKYTHSNAKERDKLTGYRLQAIGYRDKDVREKMFEKFERGLGVGAAGVAREAGVAIIINKPLWVWRDAVDCTQYFE